MIHESGRIVAIEPDSLWVETIQKTACGNCAASKGCGQGMLGQWMARASHIRVLLDGRDPGEFRIDQTVTLGIPEDVMLKSSFVVYLLPVMLLIAGALLGQDIVGTETAAMLGSLAGLIAGGVLVRVHAHLRRHDRRLQPVLLDT